MSMHLSLLTVCLEIAHDRWQGSRRNMAECTSDTSQSQKPFCPVTSFMPPEKWGVIVMLAKTWWPEKMEERGWKNDRNLGTLSLLLFEMLDRRSRSINYLFWQKWTVCVLVFLIFNSFWITVAINKCKFKNV